MAFGLLLHKVVNPIIMAIIFFGVVAPIGLLMRMLGQRPLALKFDASAPTYWIRRPEREHGAMTRQF